MDWLRNMPYESQPVKYSSRALTETEKRYSQTEKEMLSIVFGFTRFYAYTYGRRVTICNGHKPLAVVLKNKAQTILLDSRECYAESSNMTFRIDQT